MREVFHTAGKKISVGAVALLGILLPSARLSGGIVIALEAVLWMSCNSGPPPFSSVTSVSISPADPSFLATVANSTFTTVSVSTGASLQLKASVNGTGNPDSTVVWSVDNQVDANDTTLGTITQDGLYTAPAVVPYPSALVVRATSAF